MNKLFSNSNLRWVILLLAIAVILPTVCLLWFMTQAVKNERLAVRQKFMDIYEKRAGTFFVEYPNNFWESELDRIASSGNIIKDFPPQFFVDSSASNSEKYCGVIIYDMNGGIIWPSRSNPRTDPNHEFLEKAWKLEYADNDPNQALIEYEKISGQAEDHQTRYAAAFGQLRCLEKLGKTNEAVNLAFTLSYPLNDESMDIEKSTEIMRARVMLAQLYRDNTKAEFFQHLRRCLAGGHYNDEKVSGSINASADIEIWGLSKLVEIARNSPFSGRLKKEIEVARRKIETRLISFETASDHPDYEKVLPLETIHRLDTTRSLYGYVTRNTGVNILMIIPAEYMVNHMLAASFTDFNDDTAFCQIYDDAGSLVLGDEIKNRKPFMKSSLGSFLPGFSAHLYFRDDSVLEAAARKQSAVYIWLGMLVVLLILGSGAIAAQVVGRQIKLNRLKNDFIATVTHELKTPLASMRVLTDTLIEKNYEDDRTPEEYLHMIGKENERLSRLIDNFLTFSRMERNKQAFDIVKTNPAEIAKAAAEAVQTKFNHENCKFTVTIADNLASIMADKDAMVTVLVNLLDNAYKYSYDNKQIELTVSSQDSYICFSVKDNGIGMTRRQIKRVFDRFYQADSSLSRQAEGTGLGLSIVKFIVDAHKGKITLDSKPSKGSKFTIRLPKVKDSYGC